MPSDAEARQHQWRIDPREYARHEARRGRRFAFVNLVPTRTALVVIDMVPFFVSGNPYCRGVVPNIDHIADALRVAGGTVAWVLPAVGERTPVLDEFFGPETAEAYRVSGGTGPLPERLWPELVVRPGDVCPGGLSFDVTGGDVLAGHRTLAGHLRQATLAHTRGERPGRGRHCRRLDPLLTPLGRTRALPSG